VYAQQVDAAAGDQPGGVGHDDTCSPTAIGIGAAARTSGSRS